MFQQVVYLPRIERAGLILKWLLADFNGTGQSL